MIESVRHLGAAHLRQMPVQPFQPVEDLSGLAEQGAAEVGRHHAAAAPLEQRAAQPRLQPRQAAGQRGLPDRQHAGGARQAAMLGDGADQDQVADFQHMPFREG